MNTYKTQIVELANAMVTTDLGSKKLFLDTFALIKDNNVNNVKASVNGLVDDAKEALADKYTSNIVNRIVNTIKLAGSWYGEKIFTQVEELYFYNIEDTVKVINSLKDLASNEKSAVTVEDVKKAKNQLSRIDFKDNIQYNNDYADKIKAIKKEHQLYDVDGKIVQMENSIQKLWEMLDETQKNNFKEFINKLD